MTYDNGLGGIFLGNLCYIFEASLYPFFKLK